MIIDLRTISPEPGTFEYILGKDWWGQENPDDRILALDVPLQVKITIYPAGDKYVLDGELSGGFKARCDRCLGPHYLEIKTDFQVYLAPPLPESEEPDVELIEDDMDTDFIRGEEIELDDIVREQIYLSLPMKLACSADCKGLCPTCGVNLNETECQCRQEAGHPAFLKLKNFKIQEE